MGTTAGRGTKTEKRMEHKENGRHSMVCVKNGGGPKVIDKGKRSVAQGEVARRWRGDHKRGTKEGGK